MTRTSEDAVGSENDFLIALTASDRQLRTAYNGLLNASAHARTVPLLTYMEGGLALMAEEVAELVRQARQAVSEAEVVLSGEDDDDGA